MGLSMGSPVAAEPIINFKVMEGEDKNHLQQSLPNLQFAEPDDHLDKVQCQNCHHVALSHYIASCDHLFCGSCYEKFCLRHCPIDECTNEVIDQVTHDVDLEKAVYELRAFCENRKAGCEATVCLQDYLEHLKTCTFRSKLNAPSIDSSLQVADEISKLKRSVRDLQEKLSRNEEMLKLSLYNERRLSAEMGLMEDKLARRVTGPQKAASGLPNQCLAKAPGPKSEAHAEQLKKIVVEHVTEEFGKKITDQITDKLQIQMEEMKQEVTDKFRRDVQQLAEQLIELRQSCTETKRQIEEMDSKFVTSAKFLLEKNSTKFIWKLKGFRQLIRNFKTRQWKDIDSETCVTKEHGYKIQAKLEYECGYLLLKLCFLDEDDPNMAESNQRPSVYYHRTTFQVLDQSEHWEKRHIVRIEEPSFGDRDARNMMRGFYGPAEFAALQLLQQDETYVKDDTVMFKIMVEPLSVLYKTVAVHDGTLLWKVDRYFKKKQDEIDGLIFCLKSDYFYTSAKGYRLQALLCLNGYGQGYNGKFLSAYVHFVRGEWDDFLPDFFPHRTTFMILDQSHSAEKEHWVKTFRSTRTTTDSAHDFALQHEIETDAYLKDDSLLIKVKVDP